MTPRILLFFFFFLTHLHTHAAEQVQFENITFIFISPQNCAEFAEEINCTNLPSHIKDWSKSEKDFVRSLLRENKLKKNALIQELKKPIFLSTSSQGVPLAETFRNNQSSLINLNPTFFSSFTSLSLTPQVTKAFHVLIHELVHVWTHSFDGYQNFIGDLENSMGWLYGDKIHPYINMSDYSQKWHERQRLALRNQLAESEALDLQYALSQGFPSMYSMLQSEEYFAELIAYLSYQEDVQSVLTEDLQKLLQEKTPFETLVEAFRKNDHSKSLRQTTQDQHIGYITLDNRPLCTVSMIKHGLLLTAKHCFKGIEPQVYDTKAKATFLSFIFPSASEPTSFSGLSVDSISLDSGYNDLAYVHYDSKITEGKITLPDFEVVPLNLRAVSSLNLKAYATPSKPKKLKLLESNCTLTGRSGYIQDKLSQYEGLLYETECPAYFLSSGAPLYTTVGDKTYLIGVLSHTFSTDESGTPLPEAIQQDFWGLYTDSNISLLSDGVDFFPLDRLSQNQEVLIQALEQKLRDLLDHPADPLKEVQLKANLNILITKFNLDPNKLLAQVMVLLKQEQAREVLIDDESLYSLKALSFLEIQKAHEILSALVLEFST